MQRLFTVTRDGRPIAVVLARDFAEVLQVAAELCGIDPQPANDANSP